MCRHPSAAPFPALPGRSGATFAPSRPFLRSRRHQVPHPNQIVCRRSQRHHPSHLLAAPPSHLPQSRHRLQPPKHLLHPLPRPLAQPVPLVPHRPAIHSAATPACVLRARLVQPRPELQWVVTSFAARTSGPRPLRHRQRRLTLGLPVRLRHPHVHQQPVPVLRHHMPQVAQLRLRRLALPPQSRLRGGR